MAEKSKIYQENPIQKLNASSSLLLHANKQRETIKEEESAAGEKMATLDQSPYDARIFSKQSKDSESQQDTKACMVSAGIYSDYAPTDGINKESQKDNNAEA